MKRPASTHLAAALAVLVLLGAALLAGCTSDTTDGTATTAPTASPSPAGTHVATATTAGTSGSGTAAAAIAYDRLIPLLPASAGTWTLDGDPQGMTMKDGEGREYTWVTAEYTGDGDAAAQVLIQDTAAAETPYRQQWNSFSSYESTQGWWRAVTVDGQPGWRYHDASSDDYGTWVLVGDRFIVYALVNDGTEADLDALVDAIDIAGLAALK
ncbi:MAG: hypothetical protein GXY82_01315 [Methanospirillum sp.]|nr:hypothetical protein [Methanospirillum sp.]